MNELLAPVGKMENLVAAINGGADAVYLSGPSFGARTSKANFALNELKYAIELAHLYGVSVYITLNTLIHQDELLSVYSYIDQLAAFGVDAIIVQDLAVIDYISKHYPTLPIHASTQMSVYDLDGVRTLKSMGVSRVVIAREASIDEIKHILSKEKIELEVFVHGALCHAYSGQCMISSVIGGRSGNRGKCAQTCRLKFNIDHHYDAYAMSMKDLSTIDHIDALKKLGIASLKIEGRLRHADYVYHTVRAYRAAIDGADQSTLRALKEKMYLSFNRSYTGGHLTKDKQRLTVSSGTNLGEEVGVVLPKRDKYKLQLKLSANLRQGDALKFFTGDVSLGTKVFNIYHNGQKINQADSGQLVSIDYQKKVPEGTKVYRTRSQALSEERLADEHQRRLSLDINIHIDREGKLTANASCCSVSINLTDLSGQIPKHKSLDKTSLLKQFSKLGDTPFELNVFTAKIESEIFMPASTLNQIRRTLTDGLSKKLARSMPHLKKTEVRQTVLDNADEVPYIIAVIDSEEQFEVISTYNNVRIVTEKMMLSKKLGIGLTKRPYSKVSSDYVVTSDIGGIQNRAQILDYHSQIMNSAAYDTLYSMGIKDITLSPELGVDMTKELAAIKQFRIFAYGKLPVMYTKTCIKKQEGQICSQCTKSFTLSNSKSPDLIADCNGDVLRYNTDLPMIREWAWTELCAPLFLRFTNESSAEVKRVLDAVYTKSSM